MAFEDQSDIHDTTQQAEGALDDVDRGILFALQRNARSATTTDIGDEVGVSASTVRNRIEKLEGTGVITGYSTDINYERAGFQLNTQFVCSVGPKERETTARAILDIPGVVDVREMLTGERNLYIEVVAMSTRDLAKITDSITELGVVIISSELITNHYRQPFSHLEKV